MEDIFFQLVTQRGYYILMKNSFTCSYHVNLCVCVSTYVFIGFLPRSAVEYVAGYSNDPPPRFPAEAQALCQAASPPSVAPHLLRHRYRMPHPTLHNVWAKDGGRCGSRGTVAGLLGIMIFKCEVWAGRGTQGLLLVLFVFGIWETGTEVGKPSRYSAIDQIGPTQHNSESSAWHVSSSAERTMISVSQHVFQPWWLNQGTAC